MSLYYAIVTLLLFIALIQHNKRKYIYIYIPQKIDVIDKAKISLY